MKKFTSFSFYFNSPSNQKRAYNENGFSELTFMRKKIYGKSMLGWQRVFTVSFSAQHCSQMQKRKDYRNKSHYAGLHGKT